MYLIEEHEIFVYAVLRDSKANLIDPAFMDLRMLHTQNRRLNRQIIRLPLAACRLPLAACRCRLPVHGRHSRESGNPSLLLHGSKWIPAFAGMTAMK